MLVFEIAIIVALTLLNGVFAMSELAVVSSRKSRLQPWPDEGVSGARTALRLIDDPSRFLSTVQIGITMVGVVAGAYGGATLGDRLGKWLGGIPALAGYGRIIGVGSVLVLITYSSIVIGELIPKRIALKNPERTASLIARPMSPAVARRRSVRLAARRFDRCAAQAAGPAWRARGDGDGGGGPLHDHARGPRPASSTRARRR